jgi:hypothetical protein
VKGNEDLTPSGETVPGKALENSPFKKFLRVLRVLRGENCRYRLKRPVKTKPKQESKRMRQQTGSRNRGWLPAIGNRLSVAAGVALVAGMMAGTAWGQSLLATGGDTATVIAIDGKNYGVHSFTNVGSATFTPSQDITVEYLVIGGGGGGGSAGFAGGGGGAGGYRSSVTNELSGSNTVPSEAQLSLSASTPYFVYVGAGGAADANGKTSVFHNVVSQGGGAGGNNEIGHSGGCGGGGGLATPTGYAGGSGTVNQGMGGGATARGNVDCGGGGGGAGQTGLNGTLNAGGAGGTGIVSAITGQSVQRAGGGGGGGGWGPGGAAGAGGGGAGDSGNATNTFGGGGGGAGEYGTGGAGGSGIVIVRYAIQATVKVTAPTNNQVFAWNYASIAATATVANATVTSVDFYTNTASAAYGLAGSDNTSGDGYTLSLASGSLPAGTNHIYAVMNANEGTFTSAVNTIIVETLPVVTVAYPTDGQSFANLASITAAATVSHGIAPYTVTFYTNNETAVGSDGSAPYASSSLGPLGEGSYQIYAKVTDSNPNGADTVYSTTNTFTILAPALAVSVAGPTEYPYDGMIASTATVTFVASPYTVKFWTSSVPATVWGQAGTDGISTSPYGVSFGPLAPGQYSIRATVDDSFPAAATSSTYTVTVLTAPTVTLNTPTPGQQFALNSSVTGTVTCTPGKAPYTVTFYTNENGSAYGAAGTDVDTGTRTAFTNVLSSLGAGTYGMYAVVSDGYGSQATSGTNIFLVGGTLPTLSHRPPTDVTTGSATFNGFLSTTGNPSTYVYVLYGQNPNAWSFTNAVTAPGGGWTNNSPISQNIGSLTAGLTYYYTIGASNGAPFNATTTASGTTNFITGEVTVQATDASAQHPGNNGQFTIYRPDTCTNAALVVSYTLSGATVSPAGSATLNAGSTSAVVTVAPSLLVGYSSNAVLTLTAGAGNYPYGTPVANSATCTVLAADVTPTAPFWAWGGDSNFTTTVSGRPYAVHMYTNVGSGYFIPSRNIKNVEYLVIGGGGGGGRSAWGGGGGGAGGYRCSVVGEKSGGNTDAEDRTNLTSGVAIEVRVGVGGEGVTDPSNGAGNQGSNSWFGGIIALGGGGGGLEGTFGSGGGANHGGAGAGPAGSGTVRQGCNGGDTWATAPEGGGGGGGAATNGNGLVSGANGKGGDGLASSITGGTPVTRAGGGKGQNGSGDGSGASEAGGGGSRAIVGGNGTAGKNGIVIVRYEISPPAGTLILMR